MKKKLPQTKKTLKSFILEEDAKIIDKTATKVALTASFLAASFALSAEDVNAKGHANYTEHNNFVYHEGNDPALGNDLSEEVSRSYSNKGFGTTVKVEGKEVASVHGNHFNHTNSQGKK